MTAMPLTRLLLMKALQAGLQQPKPGRWPTRLPTRIMSMFGTADCMEHETLHSCLQASLSSSQCHAVHKLITTSSLVVTVKQLVQGLRTVMHTKTSSALTSDNFRCRRSPCL